MITNQQYLSVNVLSNYWRLYLKEIIMPVKDEAIMKNIQQLSVSLSMQQLEQFVTVIESLAELLQVANKDTEKAYSMYLNSIESTHEETYINTHDMPLYHGITNVIPLKH